MPTKKRQSTKTSKSPSKSKRATTASFHPLKVRTWPGGRWSAAILIVVVAACGIAFVAFSHAATQFASGVTVGSTPGGVHLCMDGSEFNGPVSMFRCNGNNPDQLWQISGSQIELLGSQLCLQGGTSKGAAFIAQCNGSNYQKWAHPSGSTWSGYLAGALYNVGDWNGGKGQRNCLVDPNGANEQSSGGWLITVGCGTNAQLKANPAYEDQIFSNYTYAVTGTGNPTPKPTPRPVTTACVNNTYSTANSSIQPCVSNIQSILNGAEDFYGHGGGGTIPYNGKILSIDASFGPATAAQVKVLQNYFYGSSAADGVVGPQTWRALCYVAFNHDAPGASDYKLAGCTQHSL